MFEFVDAALLRLTAHTTPLDGVSWPDLADAVADDPAERVLEWRQWLQHVWALEEFAAAVELASPSLARDVQRVCDGVQLPGRKMRRMVISIVKYLLRATSRATPFGLFAGVAPVRVGREADVRLGRAHRTAARVDAEWLDGVITRVESCAGLRQRLPVVANDLAFVRDGRLVINCQRRSGSSPRDGASAAEVSVRFSRAVEIAVREARSPIRILDIAVVLAAEFPRVAAAVIDTMLANLVEQRFLLTCLRPPMTATDPLGHVVEHAGRAGAAAVPDAAELVGELQGVHLALVQHDQTMTTPNQRRALRQLTSARMAALGPGEPALGVDLGVDAVVVLPDEVVREAETAAAALARLAPAPAESTPWRKYAERFLDRYGIGAIVPIRDIVDPDIGLGYPAGFRDSLLTSPTPRLGARDLALMAMAQRSALEQELEVVLDDDTVAGLEADGFGTARQQPHTELMCQLHAATRASLNAGEFRLSITGMSRAAGTTTGRFLDLLDPADRQRMLRVYAALPMTSNGAVLAQVSCAPVNPRAESLARSPRVLPHRIPLAEHDTGEPGAIPLTDLAVSGDIGGLYLMSVSRRQPVEPMAFSAVEFARSAHPMLRFLCEISTARSALCGAFSWGAARNLPFLPRIRYRRTILSPARWRLTAADLGDARDIELWRRRYRVPDTVFLGEDDRRLRLDLTEPAHQHVLRDTLERHGARTLLEAPKPTAFGWLDGRAHELVLPLASTQTPGHAPRPPRRSDRPTTIEHGHLPAASPWLSATIVAHPERHSTILTAHLPDLLSNWGSEPEWWFIRHHDPEHHLRLRIRIPAADGFGAAAQRVGDWSRRLRQRGLVGQLRFETYYPETGRFGIEAAMTAAESVFAADSAGVIAQLTYSKDIPRDVVIAASVVDMVIAFIGDIDDGLRWCLDHLPRTTQPRPARVLRDQAISLANPRIQYPALRGRAGGERIAVAWARRRTALAAYRTALADADDPNPDAVLPDLLHLHHVRMAGISHDSERFCLHLARAAALSWTTRIRGAA